MKTLFWFWKF
uniref:Uncharacterized protein n=1 Tax=Anguilla anguilla TaxID=7936 RepID=A0A0E9XVA6_ANGAN